MVRRSLLATGPFTRRGLSIGSVTSVVDALPTHRSGSIWSPAIPGTARDVWMVGNADSANAVDANMFATCSASRILVVMRGWRAWRVREPPPTVSSSNQAGSPRHQWPLWRPAHPCRVESSRPRGEPRSHRAIGAPPSYCIVIVTPPTAAETSAPTRTPLSCRMTQLAFCNCTPPAPAAIVPPAPPET
jgi:hypothetical protein